MSQTVYNPNSQVSQTIDANNHTNRVTFDTANRPSVVTDAKGNTTTYAHDANGNIVTVTEVDKSDASQPDQTFVTTSAYDSLNRLIQTTDNLGQSETYAYDSRNNRVRSTDFKGNPTLFTYDGLDRLVQTAIPLTDTGDGSGTVTNTIITGQTWDDSSRLTAQTDAHGNATTYAYDALDRQVSTVYADGTTRSTVYDVHDNPVTINDANGSATGAAFDLLDRVTARSIFRAPGIGGTSFENYQYDGLSRVVSAVNDDSQVTTTYNSLSDPLTETQQAGRVVTSTYDGVGNLTQLVYPGGRTIVQVPDALDRLSLVRNDPVGPGSTIATYGYLGPQRVERRDYGNGLRLAPGYDPIRRVSRTLHTPVLPAPQVVGSLVQEPPPLQSASASQAAPFSEPPTQRVNALQGRP